MVANPAGPQCRAVDDAIEVTFWWRDPAGMKPALPIVGYGSISPA
nr:Uncharacterised protein [Klebsiella pneumoniae]